MWTLNGEPALAVVDEDMGVFLRRDDYPELGTLAMVDLNDLRPRPHQIKPRNTRNPAPRIKTADHADGRGNPVPLNHGKTRKDIGKVAPNFTPLGVGHFRAQ